MNKTKQWQVLKKRTVFKNRWRRIDEWEVRRPNGSKGKYYYTILPDVVLIFAVIANNQVVLNNQYYIYGGFRRLEVPAGYVHGKEAPIVSARRELMEETGYRAKKWVKLGSTSSGKWNNYRIHYFLATSAYKAGKQKLEPSEDIQVKLLPLKNLIQQLNKKMLDTDLSLTCCYLALNKLKLLKIDGLR